LPTIPVLFAPAFFLVALSAADAVPTQGSATVQVTATRFPEDPAKVPTSITVISGRELAERGVSDLRSALALAAGVFIAPGGDGGPASSIPEFWGLKEIDAFLLVVDGVPWGGAFNPALATLNLQDVERIEVQRGAGSVLYGATSFVGVIHVIHRQPAEARGSVTLSGGSHGSGAVAITLPLPRWGGFASSLTVDHAKEGFSDPRTGFERTHLLWRNRAEVEGGTFHFDLDGTALDQDPASPRARVGATLSPLAPLDANHNPDGAFLRDRRVALSAGYDRGLGAAVWSSLLSVSQSRQNALRGFLTDVTTDAPNAHGFREHLDTTDLYLDTHVTWSPTAQAKVVAGLDHLQGTGTGRGGDFDYFVNLDGSGAPGARALPSAADVRIDDHRAFTGLYGFTQWLPVPALVLEAGLRLNHTRETRSVSTLDFASATQDAGRDEHTVTRLTGSAGANWAVWQEGRDRVAFFATYRDSFKPSAIDFGLDSQAQLLKPETAQSTDFGLKASLLDGALALEVSVFRMDFDNLVVSQSLGGLPVLVNAGKERFQGLEASLVCRFAGDFAGRLAYSNHDARFSDYVADFGGVATQLRGKRLEVSPYHLAAAGLVYAPREGFQGNLEANYRGSVFLDKRNHAPAGGFATLGASLGYRRGAWEGRITGQNLTDRRDPVAESEMGDAQYYLLPGRRVTASLRMTF
jgi:outer membrane receptor protein involved in Fe transport